MPNRLDVEARQKNAFTIPDFPMRNIFCSTRPVDSFHG